MQKIKPLPTVPREYAQAIQAQLDAALQIIAALILTKKEAKEINSDCSFADWPAQMKADLLGQRPRLVEALKAQGFLTNSDAGYCLAPLEERIPSPWLMSRVTVALEEVVAEYVDGVGEELCPDDMKGAKTAFAQRVRARVQDPHYAEALAPQYDAAVAWLFESGVGTQHMLLAAQKRLVNQARQKRKEEEEE